LRTDTRKLEELFLRAAMGCEPKVRILLRPASEAPEGSFEAVEKVETFPGPNLPALRWVLEQRAKSAPTGIEPLPFAAWTDDELLKMLKEGASRENLPE